MPDFIIRSYQGRVNEVRRILDAEGVARIVYPGKIAVPRWLNKGNGAAIKAALWRIKAMVYGVKITDS
jgi:hypothetical protein